MASACDWAITVPASRKGHGRYVGRVGALAVALGVGFAVAAGGSGVAWAEDGASDTGSPSNSESDSTKPADKDPDSSDGDQSSAEDNADADSAGDADSTDDADPADEADSMDDPDSVDGNDEQVADDDAGAEVVDTEPVVSLPQPNSNHSPAGPVDEPVSPPTQPAAQPSADRSDQPEVDATPAPPEVAASRTAVISDVDEKISDVDEETVAVVSTAPTGARLQSEFSTATFATTSVAPAVTQGPATRIVSALLAAIGIGPAASTVTPVSPAAPQTLIGVLALIRREIEHFFFNKAPTFDQEVTLDVDSTAPQSFTIAAFDPDGDRITYTVRGLGEDGGPDHGTVTVDPTTGTLTYTADDGYEGTDSFDVIASDAGEGFHLHGLASLFRPRSAHTGTITVGVNVDTVNETPVAVDDEYDVDEDGNLAPGAPGLLDNDTDADNDDLSVVEETKTTQEGGTVTLNADGSFTYTPAEDFNGTDTFSYTVVDDSAEANNSDIGLVTVVVGAVNDAPIAGNDAGYVVAEDGTLSGTGLLANDTDVDNDDLSVVEETKTTANGGTVTLNADGSFTYTPAGDFNGTDTFAYTVRDPAGATDVGTVTITVTPVNNDDNEISSVITIGHGSPNDVAVSPDGTTAYVANPDGTVSVIDIATGNVTSNTVVVPAGHIPKAVAVSNGHLYVASVNGGAGTLTVYRTTDYAVVKTIAISGTPNAVVAEDGRIYVASTTAPGQGALTIVDATSYGVLKTITSNGAPVSLVISDSGLLYLVQAIDSDPAAPRAGSLRVYDTTADDGELYYLAGADGRGELAVTTLGDGRDRAYQLAPGFNESFTIDVDRAGVTYGLVSSFGGNSNSTAVAVSDTRGYIGFTNGALAVFNLADNQQIDANPAVAGLNPIRLPAGVTPVDIEVDSNGKQVYVVGNDGKFYAVNIGDAEAPIDL